MIYRFFETINGTRTGVFTEYNAESLHEAALANAAGWLTNDDQPALVSIDTQTCIVDLGNGLTYVPETIHIHASPEMLKAVRDAIR